jgi:hypothetical protein
VNVGVLFLELDRIYHYVACLVSPPEDLSRRWLWRCLPLPNGEIKCSLRSYPIHSWLWRPAFSFRWKNVSYVECYIWWCTYNWTKTFL